MPYRINPVVGGGEHAILSTATKLSKFGLPLIEETKERIIELYKSYKWMNGIHAHVGSQGIPIHLFANSVKVRQFCFSNFSCRFPNSNYFFKF